MIKHQIVQNPMMKHPMIKSLMIKNQMIKSVEIKSPKSASWQHRRTKNNGTTATAAPRRCA